MKTDIGLTGNTDVVYRTMLRHSRWSPGELSDALGWPLPEVTDHLGQMRADGLVTASVDKAGAYRAVEPALALPTLVLRCFRKLDEDVMRSRFGGVQGVIALRDRYAEQYRHNKGLRGFDEMAATVERYATGADEEITFLVPRYVPGAVEFSAQLAESALRRNVTLRSIWAAELMRLGPAEDHARWLDNRCAAPRFVAKVPAWAVLIDKRVAVTIDSAGVVEVQWDERALGTLYTAAERLWCQGARTRGAVPTAGMDGGTDRLESVLSLLSDGLTDDAVARRLGVSVRTVRNDVASTMKVLESRSRFQAGATAARLGLI
ncbi:LuxR C-terminal-related transcriptional regulator [Sciscionella marina]|uniref:LuxR C-terminal-related transcriptional regulator n=1 Tax=Sciscionella marina TaxID=508770 RepID=UPI0003713948|nr:LuxR C-terminal-related transcriptional regulator [Sciscionella marina]